MINANKATKDLVYITWILFVFVLANTIMGCAEHNTVESAPVHTFRASSDECPSGGTEVFVSSSKYVVCNGAQGDPGAQGPAGVQGPAGTPGTVVSIVPLCPGAPSYPSVFIEDAICVDGKLYGVYSIPGSFLTYLPPGSYSSNAIGSACNLEIHSNCVVSH